MAITQVGTGSGSANTSEAQCTPSGSRQVNDIVIVVGYQRPGTALSVAASGLTFNAVVTATNDATYGSMGAWWARYSSTSNPQITLTGSSSSNLSIAVACVVLRGADRTSNPLTQVGSITNQAAASSFTVTGPTGVAADTVMIGVGGSLDNNAPTADWSGGAGTGSSVTVDNTGGTDNALGLAWEWVSSGTAGNFVYTETANGNDAGRTLIFGVLSGVIADGSITLGGSASAGTRQELPVDPVGITDSLHVVTGAPATDAGVGVTDTVTPDLTVSGTPASASGSLSLSGSAGAKGAATAAGALTLGGSAAATVSATAAGSVTLGGSGDGKGVASVTGALSLSGSGVGRGAATAAGSLALSASAVAGAAGSITGAVTLTGSAEAKVAATAAGSVTLGGTAGAAATATAAGSLTLSGSATAGEVDSDLLADVDDAVGITDEAALTVGVVAAGSLTLSGSGSGKAAATASGAVTLSGSATTGGPASAAGALTLAGSAAGKAAAIAAGSVTLSGAAGGAGPAAASGALALAGSGAAQAPATAAGAVTLSGAVAAGADQTRDLTDPLGITDTIDLGMGIAAAGALTLGGTVGARGVGSVAGALTLAGSSVARAPITAAGTLALGGTATGKARLTAGGGIVVAGNVGAQTTAAAAGTLTLSGVAATRAPVTAAGALNLTGSGTAQEVLEGSAIGSLSLIGWAVLRAFATKPPRLEAMLTALLADVGAVKVWAVDSTPTVRGVAEATTVQVQVRASSKQAARARAYTARELILALPGDVWHDGIVSGITDMQGPAWSPDTDGAPRYIFRCTVHYRPARTPSMT